MSHFRDILLSAFVVFAFSVSVPDVEAQQDEKLSDAVTLAQLAGVGATGELFSNAVLPELESSVRHRFPEISDADMAQLREETALILRIFGGQFVREMGSVYAERFSHEEIREALDFFRTETGRKLVEFQFDPTTSGQDPMFSDRFTKPELREIVEFYQTSGGKALSREREYLRQRGSEVGSQLGALIGAKAEENMVMRAEQILSQRR